MRVPARCNTSEALAINSEGDLVGFAGSDAMLWSRGRGIDLNRLLPAGAHWHLTQATGINNHGWIVGYGTHDSPSRAFLLTPAVTKHLSSKN